MGPWSIVSIMGNFTAIFAPKLITLFFHLLRQNAAGVQIRLLYGEIHPSSSIRLSRISGDNYIDDDTSGTKSTTSEYA